jgi:hypothetical protein
MESVINITSMILTMVFIFGAVGICVYDESKKKKK